MANLSEITEYYIDVSFQPALKTIIYEALAALEFFGKKFYEDSLIELIQREDTITSDTKRDMFMAMLEDELKDIIKSHLIELNKDEVITIKELTELTQFLYIVQRLEDYEFVTRRIYSDDTNRNILIDIIVHYTTLNKLRLMEIISYVPDTFINGLKEFIKDKPLEEEIDVKHSKRKKLFFKFIGDTKCLGSQLYDIGYDNVTLEELFQLSRVDIEKHIAELELNNFPQAALDCLSVLILCKDSTELPLLAFKQNSQMFTSKLDTVSKLEVVMSAMLSDFYSYLEAQRQQEQLK